MTIVVTGLVATYPLGGVAWDYLAYVDGFRRMGLEVFYLEDTGGWFYDPLAQSFTDLVGANLRFLEDALRIVGVGAGAWAVRAPDGQYHGASAARVRAVCRAADLWLNVSGACWLREAYRGARCHAYLDTDPGYSQAKLWAVEHGQASREQEYSVGLIRAHDRFLTLAEHVGAPDCRLPACGLDWRPTRQPVVLAHWPFSFRPAARAYTTVMSWKTDVTLPLIDGVRYGGKSVEFWRFVELPARTDVVMETAVAGAVPAAALRSHGWTVTDGQAVSATMGQYRDYLRGSRGEWSVAKQTYVALRTGWFSTRSAAYLALGKPVVGQDTGWSAHHETGAGLFAFTTVEQAAAALETIEGRYRSHCEAARALAERDFEAERVLTRLLRDCGL